MKKLLSRFLVLVFILSAFMTTVSFAGDMKLQDGFSAQLTSGKTEYAANEDIDIKLTVSNMNEEAVSGIKTKINLPEQLELKSGDLEQMDVALDAGAAVENSIVAIKKVEQPKAEKPTDSDTKKPADQTTKKSAEKVASKKTAATNTTDTNTTKRAVKTGDNRMAWIWLTILCVSAALLIYGAVKYKKISKTGLLSIALCLIMTGAIGIPMDAQASSVEPETLQVSEELTVAGEKVTITADITYDVEKYHVEVECGSGTGDYRAGDIVTITFDEEAAKEAADGDRLDYWSCVEEPDFVIADHDQTTATFVMPEKDITIVPSLYEYEVNIAIEEYTADPERASSGKVEFRYYSKDDEQVHNYATIENVGDRISFKVKKTENIEFGIGAEPTKEGDYSEYNRATIKVKEIEEPFIYETPTKQYVFLSDFNKIDGNYTIKVTFWQDIVPLEK